MLHDDEKRSAAASEQEGAPAPERGDIEAFLQSEDLTEGQRRRLRVLQAVEQAVTARVEEMCSTTTVEVTDVAVLVVAPEARALVFDGAVEPGISVVVGERNKLHAFLTDVLPPAPDAAVDPYADLLSAAPPLCVRVLVLDEESLTVLSYGTFLTVRLGEGDVPEA